MKKGIRILYFVTVVISALVGLWHFFVPWMFQWYDYLPMQYENLIVGIDYTNYCFSLLLLGLSVMLILLGKRALDMNREVIYFYFFLTVAIATNSGGCDWTVGCFGCIGDNDGSG